MWTPTSIPPSGNCRALNASSTSVHPTFHNIPVLGLELGVDSSDINLQLGLIDAGSRLASCMPTLTAVLAYNGCVDAADQRLCAVSESERDERKAY